MGDGVESHFQIRPIFPITSHQPHWNNLQFAILFFLTPGEKKNAGTERVAKQTNNK